MNLPVYHEECVDVLIGRPESKDDDKIENLLEQLRVRQLSLEQIETYGRQEAAAAKERTLNEVRAQAMMQKELTDSKIAIEIASNNAEADLVRARKQAEQTVQRPTVPNIDSKIHDVKRIIGN